MGVFSENAIIGASSAGGDYEIENSSRITGGKLVRTPTSAGNRRTWTYSAWVKRSILDSGSTTQGDSQTIFSAGPSSSQYFYLAFSSSVYSAGYDDTLYLDEYSFGQQIQKNTSQKFRDIGGWYHIVVAVDTTQATASNRIKVYVNGEQVTDWARDTNPPLNYDSQVNSTSFHGLGESSYGSGAGYWQYHGYLAEVHFVDGQALTAADFGETDSATNQWKPVEYSGSYGTNGFYFPFSSTELNNFVDSSSSSHTITAVGNVTNSRVQKKIGDSSIAFDGSGDALNAGDHNDFSFGSGQFTLESWVRFNSLNRYVLIGKYDVTQTIKEYIWEVEYSANVMNFAYSTDGNARTWLTFAWTPSADTWYHVAISRDSGGDIRAFVNGTQIGSTQNVTSTFYSGTAPLVVGANYNNGSIYSTSNMDGYMDEIRVSNNARYTSNFTPSTTAFSSDANTKLLIHSDFDGGLGADYSGNFNDFSATNLVATDQVIDTPTNNFATMNPLDPYRASSSTFTEGNLKVSETGGNAKYTQVGNFGMSSGKWYFEFCGVNSDNSWMLGVADVTKGLDRGYTGSSGDGLFVYVDGDKYSPTSASGYGVSWTHGDVMGVAVDMDNNAMYFAKNNTWMNSGVPTSGSTKTGAAYTTELVGKTWVAAMGRGSTNNTITGTFNFGQDSSFAGAKTAQGNGDDGEDFYYTPPTGYKALNTNNLDDPSIDDPTAHFNTVLYTGDGTTAKSVNVGINPDFVWIKNRGATSHHSLIDTVRGDIALNSNQTIAEYSVANFDFNNDNTIDVPYFANEYSMNTSSNTYVAWNWKAGGTASSNSDGTITSSVSANPTAGFSVLTYTGNATAGATVGHGLSQAPELVINKVRGSATQWYVNATAVSDTSNKVLMLNATDALDSGTLYFNDTNPTATLITLGSYGNLNSTGSNVIYCWHSVEGYSKVGSYTGNGSADGPFIYTGFRPAFVVMKRTDNTSNWEILDNKRDPDNKAYLDLSANSNAAENAVDGTTIDMVSNGFKHRDGNSTGTKNLSGANYLYLAFAESPFKTANAR